MRVARIITRLNVGGPSIQAASLSERLTARGYETLLIHGRLGASEGDMRYLLAGSRVDTSYVADLQRPIAPARDIAALARVYRALCRFKPAIVHTHMAKAGIVGRLAALAYNRTAGRRAPARVVHTYHGHVLEGYFGSAATRVFTAAERQLARASDAIVAISPHIQRELLTDYRIGRSEQYRVVPLGFDLSSLAAVNDRDRAASRAALDIPGDAQVVTTVGRLTAIKQHDLFIETARRVLDGHPRAFFLIAGDGELRGALEASARDRGLGERTRFLGWRRDLPVIYGASDVFLLTSRNEGTPVALIESLAAAVPVVSTDVGGVGDVLRGTDAGILAGFGDADALARAVAALLHDPLKRRAMGERGRASVVARYGLDRLVDDVDRLYRDLLA
jgi:glycosyltransferase involved in cell wall biosynthesis